MKRESGPARQTYAAAGVNIDAANRAKELIKKHAYSTFGPRVLSSIGLFGGLFHLSGYEEPVLVSSIDGVGTKLKIACLLNKHDTIGLDIVNHCVNDILTCGAEPLFFLDYLALGELVSERVEAIVKGVADACREVGCALIGGETAEMPGLYPKGEYDLAGAIVGVVEKARVIDGTLIRSGDIAIGLPSTGLHTNGYSLARKVFNIDQGPSCLNRFYAELGKTLGEELLSPHRCYFREIKPLLPIIRGLAHITGGGLVGNLPRILPQGLAAHLESRSWTVPAIFSLIQRQGNVEPGEMYRVFNMGIGLVFICSTSHVDQLLKVLPEARVIGQVVEQVGGGRVTID